MCVRFGRRVGWLTIWASTWSTAAMVSFLMRECHEIRINRRRISPMAIVYSTRIRRKYVAPANNFGAWRSLIQFSFTFFYRWTMTRRMPPKPKLTNIFGCLLILFFSSTLSKVKKRCWLLNNNMWKILLFYELHYRVDGRNHISFSSRNRGA